MIRSNETVKPVSRLFPASRKHFAGSHKRAGSRKDSLGEAGKGRERCLLTRMGVGRRAVGMDSVNQKQHSPERKGLAHLRPASLISAIFVSGISSEPSSDTPSSTVRRSSTTRFQDVLRPELHQLHLWRLPQQSLPACRAQSHWARPG